MPQTHEELLTQASTDEFSRKCACISGLVFLIWDTLSAFDKECAFILKTPLTGVKFLYLFARYFGIASQILSVVYVTGPLSITPVSSETCRRWWYFQILTLVALQASIQTVLVLRVYALYKKNVFVGCILTFAILTGMGLFLYFGVGAFDDLEYSAACIVTIPPRQMVRLGGCLITTHSIILGFALCKYWHGLQEGWADIPVVSIVMRDGSSTFVAIVAMLVAFMNFSFRVKNIFHIVVPLVASSLSVRACRLIINMHSLGQSGSSSETADIELTRASALDMSFVESRRSLETVFGATPDIP
ncbi:hypothetical protein GALMADRAFT_155619 [Galerina marginata CBS 339.88]|uniref:DUF6533 domain-containing protein n=1 Tax=Galerina marginata (strain CBS 339.88) TaxID=685588 RepID=A0A067T157_GALM3|nr:hypothetical protein GALMADRAFT_155619 [Galerina marginata CBS 339.88]